MKKLSLVLAMLVVLCLLQPACRLDEDDDGRLRIVVTYSVLGALVQELVGEDARVIIAVPNGMDMHEYEPSGRDIETINLADLVVRNGLGLESGMEKVFAEAEKRGIRFFTAADYIDIRLIGPGEVVHGDDGHDHQIGAPDPHLWTDPLAMKAVIAALAAELKASFDLDVSDRAETLNARLESLDETIRAELAVIPVNMRKLVTGHESLGYFARCYDFLLIGAIVPSLSPQAEVSAADIAALKQLIAENQIGAVFTEMGTSAAVAAAVSRETGAHLVEINTHFLPADGSYFTFMNDLVRTVGEALQ
ncbi:MAG: metal ABC transporter substrate-binding protein [Dehalococcoidia bacterium]|nr:metal ABC transporter substrate-binding protein [Dehalococcoidia bacterium]